MSVYIMLSICLFFILACSCIVIYNMSQLAMKESQIDDLNINIDNLETRLKYTDKLEMKLEREIDYSKDLEKKISMAKDNIEYFRIAVIEKDKEIQFMKDALERMKAVDIFLASGGAATGTQASFERVSSHPFGSP